MEPYQSEFIVNIFVSREIFQGLGCLIIDLIEIWAEATEL